MINSVQDIANGSTIENTRLDSLVQRVQALEISQSLTIYNQSQPEGSNPINSEIHGADSKSRPSSQDLQVIKVTKSRL